MCEVWKGIAIVSAMPVVLITAVQLTKWRTESRLRLARSLRPYQRFLWIDFLVLVAALVIVVTHCVD